LSYIATRPGALVYIPRNEEEDQGYYISEHNKDEEEIDVRTELGWAGLTGRVHRARK
jgi:hypothetical protein